jgi:8-amino-7-oxononanoate synthase
MVTEIEKKIKEILDFAEKNELYPPIHTIEGNTPETIVNGKKVLLFCSLNYLGLSNHPRVKEAAIKAIKKYGVGAGGSRLVSGNYEVHNLLEKKLAQFKGEEDALILHTGYVTNAEVISALMNLPQLTPFVFLPKRKVIFSDELNHASIIVGCKLSKVEVVIYKHCDINDLEKKLQKYKNWAYKLIVTDSVFSMDGDIAPLPQIVELAKKYNAMVMIDEAHATGVLGEKGGGATEHFNLQGKIDVVMGTLSKAIGCLGGYIAGKKWLIKYLKAIVRPSIFSVFLPPAIAAAAIAALEEIQQNQKLRTKLWENAEYLRENLKGMGFNTLGSQTPIIPILIGEEKKAIKMAELLFKHGIYASCIRWPAVPKGKARIRFIVMAQHTKEHIDTLLNVCEKIGRVLKII